MNQSDNDKKDIRAAKNKLTQLSGDLNSTHKSKPLKEAVFNLSQKVQEELQPVTSISAFINREELAKLDNEFPGLIKDTNLLAEQVKKLSNFKVIPYEDRYTFANQKVPLCPGLISDLDKITRVKDKKFFLALEEALDNTFIINADLHEATAFKAGVLYKLFLDEDPPTRLIEMSIAIREADFPDCFKYIKKGHIRRKANWMELAEQAYDEIYKNANLDTQKRFQTSCENFKEIYLGLKFNQIDLEDIQDDEIHFPEIPDILPEYQPNCVNDSLLPKQSTRMYVNFTGNELTTLKFLIPQHKKDKVFISGDTALDTFMRNCLSEQTVVKEFNNIELRKRTESDKFIFKVDDIINDAQRAMRSDKTGKVFDAHQGYVSYKADPVNIFNEIKKIYEDYQKQQIITTDCKLTGPELIQKFFEKMDNIIESKIENEKKNLDIQYSESKHTTSFFNKGKLKSDYNQKKNRIEEKKQQVLTEMKNFRKDVEQGGPENIKIFAGQNGKAGYSFPKNSPVIDAEQSVFFRPSI